MEGTIGDFLSDEPQPETEVVAEAPQEAEPVTEGPARGPDGKFVKKEETGVETPEVAAAPTPEPVPPTEPTNQLPKEEYSALRAVRDENKELKRQLDAIQRQMMQQPQPTVEQQQTPEFWEDPQGFMASEMNRFGQTLLQQWEQRETARRLDASEKRAQAKYADYDEAFAAFEQAVQTNPQLAYQLAQADDPGEFAYAKGKTALEIQRVGSIDELRAQIRAELEAEARASFQPKPQVTLPSTTAADGSVAGRGQPQWGGPSALGDLLR